MSFYPGDFISRAVISSVSISESLKGHLLTENDLNKKIFRVAVGNLNHRSNSHLYPVNQTQRAIQLASRTLLQINPDGSFVIEGLMRGSRIIMKNDENDDNWMSTDEAIDLTTSVLDLSFFNFWNKQRMNRKNLYFF